MTYAQEETEGHEKDKKYIEKEAAVRAAQDGADEWDGGCDRNRDAYIECAIDKVLPADVKPVVRGKWKWNDDNGYYYCSECGAISPRKDQDSEYIDCPSYCHNCGADMRKEENDE
jgi:hypothetical protein